MLYWKTNIKRLSECCRLGALSRAEEAVAKYLDLADYMSDIGM